ncbi:hypothetical protein G7Y89_g8447 [Cudoniella acicularis]|uniref:Uncharacterized protein n=1 Tax=Cudoniella acicularis TaxID=354080 RepID=A0A8H4RIN8_9HELO|nr:hypothetical protein G7Y89_g8447 [Cudoniella acicularis]
MNARCVQLDGGLMLQLMEFRAERPKHIMTPREPSRCTSYAKPPVPRAPLSHIILPHGHSREARQKPSKNTLGEATYYCSQTSIFDLRLILLYYLIPFTRPSIRIPGQ